jgi:hypothetical protein
MPATPDMSDALSMDVASEPAPGGDDLFGAGAPEAAEGEPALALGEADETELDPMFAADAQDVFPDLDDAALTKLQKLIDSRLGAATAAA